MIGNQEPRIKVEPARVGTDGDDCILLMATYGYALDEWQKLIIRCWLGLDENDKYNVTSAGLSVPRQNGKNVCIEAREFYGLIVNAEKIIHTAHQVKTAKKSFRRLAAMFTDDRHPEIKEAVKSIRYTNGEESIELKNGGVIEFSARSRQAARGFDGISLVVFDEAQELTDEQLEAIMATLAASKTGNRQIIYTGTPPYPGCPGDIFKRRRENSLTNPGIHDAWHEWSIDAINVEEIDVNNHELWYKTNPSLGIWLSEEFTLEEARSMRKDGFARERLGWWASDEHIIDFALDHEKWKLCASDEMKPEGKTAYGVKFSVDGTEVVLCGAVITSEGNMRISLIKREPMSIGINWLAEWLIERYTKACCVVIDGKNGTELLIDKISKTWRVKGSIIKPTVKDILSAVTLVVDSVNEGSLSWYRQQDDLNDSATKAVKRNISGGYGFGGENSLPIEACALALFGAKNSKRDPARKMRIG